MSTAGVVAARLVRGVGAVAPPSDVLWAPNEPGDYTLYADRTFTVGEEPAGFNIATSADFPVRQPAVVAYPGPFGSDSYRTRYPSGLTDGDVSFIYLTDTPAGIAEVYACFTLRTSPDFVQESSETKLWYPSQISVGMAPSGDTDSGQYVIKATSYPAGGGDSSVAHNIAPSYLCANDATYMVEVQIVRGTPGGNDSVVRCWLSEWNGAQFPTPTLVMETTTMRIAGAAEPATFSGVDFKQYRGGVGSPTLPADQFTYCNRVRVSYKAA